MDGDIDTWTEIWRSVGFLSQLCEQSHDGFLIWSAKLFAFSFSDSEKRLKCTGLFCLYKRPPRRNNTSDLNYKMSMFAQYPASTLSVKSAAEIHSWGFDVFRDARCKACQSCAAASVFSQHAPLWFPTCPLFSTNQKKHTRPVTATRPTHAFTSNRGSIHIPHTHTHTLSYYILSLPSTLIQPAHGLGTVLFTATAGGAVLGIIQENFISV